MVLMLSVVFDLPKRLSLRLELPDFSTSFFAVAASFLLAFVISLYYLRLVWNSDATESDRQF